MADPYDVTEISAIQAEATLFRLPTDELVAYLASDSAHREEGLKFSTPYKNGTTKIEGSGWGNWNLTEDASLSDNGGTILNITGDWYLVAIGWDCNMRLFNVVQDGLTDNSNAISNAIATGKNVWLERLSDDLDLIVGSKIIISNNYQQLALFNDVTIVAGSGFADNAVIEFTGAQNTLKGNYTIKASDLADYCVYVNSSANTTIDGLRAWESNEAGLFIYNTYGTNVRNFIPHVTNNKYGLNTDTVTSLNFTNIQSYNFGGSASDFASAYPAFRINGCDGFVINGGACDSDDKGMELFQSSGVINGFNFEGTVRPITIVSSFVTITGGRMHASGTLAVNAPHTPISETGYSSIRLSSGRVSLDSIENNWQSGGVEYVVDAITNGDCHIEFSNMQVSSVYQGVTSAYPINMGSGNRIIDHDVDYILDLYRSTDQTISSSNTTIVFDRTNADIKVNNGSDNLWSEQYNSSGTPTSDGGNYRIPVDGLYEVSFDGALDAVAVNTGQYVYVTVYNQSTAEFLVNRKFYPPVNDSNGDGTLENVLTNFSTTRIIELSKGDLVRFQLAYSPSGSKSFMSPAERQHASIKCLRIGLS